MKDEAGVITTDVLLQQHARLEQVFQEIAGIVALPDGHPTTNVLIGELVRILREHCRDEQTFMRQMDYPNISGHQWQHETLLSDAELMRAGVNDGVISLATAVEGLRTVINDHKVDTDAEMFAYAARKV